ncbi:hypothetical protein ACRRTK_013673 [Alexandromys fortis]
MGIQEMNNCSLCHGEKSLFIFEQVTPLSAPCSWKSWYSCRVGRDHTLYRDVCLACPCPTECDGLNENGPHKPRCLNALSLVDELFGKD